MWKVAFVFPHSGPWNISFISFPKSNVPESKVKVFANDITLFAFIIGIDGIPFQINPKFDAKSLVNDVSSFACFTCDFSLQE